MKVFVNKNTCSFFIILALFIFPSCNKNQEQNNSEVQNVQETLLPTSPNIPVILISCDTLRADHMGCYGYSRATTPNMDRFAQDAVRFTNAFTPEVWTLTAHMTMLTGLNPEHHGLTKNLNLPENIPTLPERLHSAGYACGGFVGHEWWFLASRGYGRGFDVYQTPSLYRPIAATHAEAIDHWLPKQGGGPFFLFLHNYDIHSKLLVPGQSPKNALPFDVEDDTFRIFTKDLPKPDFRRPSHPDSLATLFLAAHNNGLFEITEEEKDYMVRAYDECVYKVDHELGNIFSKLKETSYGATNLYDAALIVLTSDHGESLGAHNAYIHGNVYEENVHVPLLIKFPKNEDAGKVVGTLVQHADLMPTILECLDLNALEQSDGESLIPIIQGNPTAEKILFIKRNQWRAMRNAEFKLVFIPTDGYTALFNLKDDPGEIKDVQTVNPDVAQKMGGQLLEHFYPLNSGWQIEINDPNGDLNCELTITTEAKIVAINSLKSPSIALPDKIGENVDQLPLSITFTLAYSSEILSIRTEPVGAPISITVHANQPIQNVLSPEPPLADFSLELDIEKQSPQSITSSPDNPTIKAYYLRQFSENQTSTQLSPKAIEELNALGYLDAGSSDKKQE